MLARQKREAERFKARTPIAGIVEEVLAQIVPLFHQADGFKTAHDHCRWQRVGEEIRPCSLAQRVNDRLRPGNIAANTAAQRLAECSCQYIDIDPEMSRGALALRSHEAGRMTIVDHHHGIILPGQFGHARQVGQIAVHREDTVGRDHDVAGTGSPSLLQLRFQIRHIGIGVAIALGLAQANTVYDRRVIERVRYDRVLWAEQRLEQAAICIETGREQNGIVLAEKLGQTLLKLPVNILGSTNEAHGRHAVALRLKSLAGRLLESRMIGQTQVIVCTKVDDLAPANRDQATLRRGDQPLAFVEPFGLDFFERLGNMRQKGIGHWASSGKMDISSTMPDICPE